ncbi:MAG TPA: hypothetical protein VMI94_29045 [Bryobacteraceae bacterium]|nr:hypothetical protein [Bryobacteraceae bacterium]
MSAQSSGPHGGCPTAVDVLTHRNGNSRTGANLCETTLTPDVVRNHFGKVFEFPVMGQVYAQPLIATQITGVPEATGSVDLALVATMENFVYAFDANGGNIDPVSGARRPYWTTHVGDPLPVNRIPKDIGAFLGHYNIEPYVGITSTPVIDPQKTTIFLTAKIAVKMPGQMYCDEEVATSDCPVVNRIFALSLATGSILDSVDISLPPPEKSQTDSTDPHPCAILDNRKPTAQDAGRINMQRPALLLTGSAQQWHIYLGFGSHQDAPCPMYHGMIVRFDFSGGKLSQFGTFMVSQPGDLDPHDSKRLGMGGVWQAGNGLVADQQGNVYFMAGNGGFDAGVRFGSNFVELDPDLKVKGWFAPWNVGLLNDNNRDIDLGASGPVLLPGTQEIVGGGKQGKLYLLKLDALGGKQKFGWPFERTNPPIQVFWAARRWSPEFIYRWVPISLAAFATGYHHIHGAPAFWGEPEADGVLREGSLYVWPERDHLKSFAYRRPPGAAEGAFATPPKRKGPQAGLGMPGGFLSISANSMATGQERNHGILWAALPLHDDAWIDIVPGALRAFEIARDGSQLAEVWTSYCAEPDGWFNFSKFVPPTVANGRVYLATFSGSVRVYGPISGEAKHNVAGCDLATVLKSPNYPEIRDPSGTGYRQTSRASRARPH